KRAKRASVSILSSHVAEQAAHAAAGVLRNLFHTKDIFLTGTPALRYQAMRAAFPHEPDCLIFDAHPAEISMAVVRHGSIASVINFQKSAGEDWFSLLKSQLKELALQNPLPRVIFLIAAREQADELRAALSGTELATFWFHDTPPSMVT